MTNRVLRAVFSTLLGAGLCLGLSPDAGHADDRVAPEKMTLEKLRALNAANREAVATATLELTVSETYRERPGGEQAARERMTDALLRTRETVLESAVNSGASERALERIQRDFDERLEAVGAAMVVRHLNQDVRVARTSRIDFAMRQARFDDQDLRDLVALAAQQGLDEDQRQYNLSQSQSHILKDDQSVTLVRAGNLAVVRASPRFDADLEGAQLGIIPDWVFRGHLKLTLRTVRGDAGSVTLELSGRKAGANAPDFLLELRPEYGYRFTRMVNYGENGEVHRELRASDYRAVDGVMVPFKTQMCRAAYNIPDYHARLQELKSARINQPFEAGIFEIPADYQVQDIRPGAEVSRATTEPAHLQFHQRLLDGHRTPPID